MSCSELRSLRGDFACLRRVERGSLRLRFLPFLPLSCHSRRSCPIQQDAFRRHPRRQPLHVNPTTASPPLNVSHLDAQAPPPPSLHGPLLPLCDPQRPPALVLDRELQAPKRQSGAASTGVQEGGEVRRAGEGEGRELMRFLVGVGTRLNIGTDPRPVLC